MKFTFAVATCSHTIVLSNGKCYFCGEPARKCNRSGECLGGARPVPSQIMYEWDGQGEDPNRDLWLCKECGEEYTQIMDDQWAEYYSSVMP